MRIFWGFLNLIFKRNKNSCNYNYGPSVMVSPSNEPDPAISHPLPRQSERKVWPATSSLPALTWFAYVLSSTPSSLGLWLPPEPCSLMTAVLESPQPPAWGSLGHGNPSHASSSAPALVAWLCPGRKGDARREERRGGTGCGNLR